MFTGVDFKHLLRNYKYLDRHNHAFINVIPGTFDTNGTQSAQYRKAIAEMISDHFLDKTHTAFYAAALELVVPLGHKDISELRNDWEHWWQFATTLDAHLAIIVH